MSGQNDEFDDIAKDLKSLEEEFKSLEDGLAGQEPKQEKTVPSMAGSQEPAVELGLSDFHTSTGNEEPSMEDTLSSLPSEEPASDMFGEKESEKEEAPASNVRPIAPSRKTEDFEEELEEVLNEVNEMSASASSNAAQDGTMTLMVQGGVRLKLKYEFPGQEVTLSFEDQCLKVELSDGAEFKIPFGTSRSNKKAA